MTKEITKAIILQEMQDKLGLRDFESGRFLFHETVIPTYGIEQHLKEYWQKFVTKSITGTGAVTVYIVPPTEKWTLSRYDVVFMTGAFTLAGVYIRRPVAYRYPTDAYIYLDLKAAQDTSYHVELPQPVVLSPGSEINFNVDGYTSTGNMRLYIDYMREEVR